MSEAGEVAAVPNGSFELFDEEGYPSGWVVRNNSEWNVNLFSVIQSPVTAQEEGIKYDIDGRAFLRSASENTGLNPFSEKIDVEGSTEYFISARINTLNLKSLNAGVSVNMYIDVNYFKLNDEPTDGLYTQAVIIVPQEKDWNNYSGRFITPVDAAYIRLQIVATAPGHGDCYNNLAGRDNCRGNIYIDNIQLWPSLQTDDTGFERQTCRLYPETDALSCDYYDDSYIHRLGWRGYCLQYDRDPGNPKACLMWYPIDRVKGDWFEEGVGYKDKFPLYYCLEAIPYCNVLTPEAFCSKFVQTVTSFGQNKYWAGRVYQGSDYQVPFATSLSGAYIDWYVGMAGNRDNVVINYIRDDKPFGSMVPPAPLHNPTTWDGNKDIVNKQPIKVYPLNTGEGQVRAGTPYYGTGITCQRTEQTGACTYLTCTGSGDDWSIYCPSGYIARNPNGDCGEGSNWDWDILYDSNGNPVGCNATEGSENVGHECCEITCGSNMEYEIADTYLAGIEGVKRLFARSYGAWEWNGSGYARITDFNNWQPPANVCQGPGGARPVYDSATGLCNGGDCFSCPGPTCDYCGVPPQIRNLAVNGQAGGVYNGTMVLTNLTFNSFLDPNQMPLLKYTILWGDGSTTTVSGIEMRAKTDPAEPHTVYHLYNYWDMKSRLSANDRIYCGAAGAVARNLSGALSGVTCSASAACCAVQPRLKIKDNWGWCNGGTTIYDCDQWAAYGGWVMATEH
jgi:hypothetical protein